MVRFSICSSYFFNFYIAFKQILHIQKISEAPVHIYRPSVPVPWTLLPFWYFPLLKHLIQTLLPTQRCGFSNSLPTSASLVGSLMDRSHWHTVISTILKTKQASFNPVLPCNLSPHFLGLLYSKIPQTHRLYSLSPILLTFPYESTLASTSATSSKPLLLRSPVTSIILNPLVNFMFSPFLIFQQHLTQLTTPCSNTFLPGL